MDANDEERGVEVWRGDWQGGSIELAVNRQQLMTNGRKATHSFFAQLLELPLIDGETGDLLGTPMAVVNWHPDGCSFPKGRLSLEQNLPHRHILWRNDEGMWLRALINHEHVEQMMRYTPGFRRWEQDLHRAATRFLAAKILEGWRTEWARRHVPTWRLARQENGLEVGAVAGQREVSTVDFVWGEHTVRVPVTSALCRVWHPDVARTLDPVTGVPRYPNGADGSKWPSDEDFEREQDQCRRELLAVSDGRAAEVIKREEVLRALVALEAFREHWHASHNEIFKVRQVFL